MSILFLGSIISLQLYQLIKENEYQNISFNEEENYTNKVELVSTEIQTIIPTFRDNSQNTTPPIPCDVSTSPIFFDDHKIEEIQVYRSIGSPDSDNEYVTVENSPPKRYIQPIVNMFNNYISK